MKNPISQSSIFDLPAGIMKAWIPVISLKQLKQKPLKRVIAGVPIVVWRAKDNDNKEIINVAKDRCPHRNYPLSAGRVENNNITCPYHGWQFGHDGVCKKIPGSCQDFDGTKYRLEILNSKICNGAVFVNFETSITNQYDIPPLADEDEYDCFWWELETANARIYDALDNVLDPFHTNFIHNGFIRMKNKRQKVIQTIDVFKNSFCATYIQDTDFGMMSRFLEGKRDKSVGHFYPPISFQGRWFDLKGLNHCVTIWFIPEEKGKMRTMLHFAMAKRRGPKWLKVLLVKLFLFKVIEQDADALEKLYNNINYFGAPKFKAGVDDRLSGYLSRLYNGQELEEESLGPFELML